MSRADTSAGIQRTYVYLILGNTLAASFIWGINTIFLLNAGLSNFEAFLANAFFTLGEVIFEIPTGIVADTWGRRTSYMLGSLTLTLSTVLYLWMWYVKGPFWGWAISSVLLGLGFTFFSGALEAWLVDALAATGYTGKLETVFAKGQTVGGAAMLAGSVAGGILAQYTSLGVPYIMRSAILLINFATAFFFMKDIGFTPQKPRHPLREVSQVFKRSLTHGLGIPPVRWMMLAAPFTTGVSLYVFYALQPFLLKLYGNDSAYGIAGLIAAIAALAQITGGLASPFINRLFPRRTTALLTGTLLTAAILVVFSFLHSFWLALVIIFLWGLLFAALTPIRQAYVNGNIPSPQRATVLSFDALMGSSGGIVTQPLLGRAADASGYPFSYLLSAAIQVCAVPFLYLAARERSDADRVNDAV